MEVEQHFPGSRVASINGKPVKNITVADLVDDLEEIYKVDNSKQAKEFRKQQKQNKLYIDHFIKQKKLT